MNGSTRDRSKIAVRYLAFFFAALTLCACAEDITMRNPRNGETTLCPGAPGGVNPWSQNYACAAGLAMQGWTRVNLPADFLFIPGVY